MDDELMTNAEAYATKRGGVLGRPLGSGIHGTVLTLQYQGKLVRSAIKVLSDRAPFDRECAVYARLRQHRIFEICGFHAPQWINSDDKLFVIEMSIVTRPFVLDFASAYLDRIPDFSDDAWAEWEEEKRELFGEGWPTVLRIRAELEALGLFQLDLSTSNIGFREGSSER